MTEQCENCRFWKREDAYEGDCRRNAPRPRDGYAYFASNLLGHIAWAKYQAVGVDPSKLEGFKYEPVGPESQASWPTTLLDDWCGEYAAKT